jgi:nitrogen fixation NifU-like protein
MGMLNSYTILLTYHKLIFIFSNFQISKLSINFQINSTMAYSEKVIDHYNNPKNVGTLDKAKTNVGTGLVGAPECGDVMRLQIEVDDATGVITDAKFKTFGCGSAIASSSLATEWLKGKTVDQAVQIDNMDLVEELNLPPVKIHCSVLAEDAIKAAINDYRKKNGLEELVFEEKGVH